jgi:hypothetical protein
MPNSSPSSLTRREILAATLTASAASAVPVPAPGGSIRRHASKRPLAITMWDFSWLERRWPGAGYEDWDQALDELKTRGYDAVRIDAYPHLVASGADKTWDLIPCWSVQDWGSDSLNRVQVQPHLNEFIGKCAKRGMAVGLSTWLREDPSKLREKIASPAELGAIWIKTLETIDRPLHKSLLYVDLCNEWPLDVWAPFYPQNTPRKSAEGKRWMRDAIAPVRAKFPELDYTFSFTSEYTDWREQDVSMLDLLELHIWMAQFSEFYKEVGYNYERFDYKGYENLQRKAEGLYKSKPAYWKSKLSEGVKFAADWSRASGKPLITTECWSVVDYKDWPLLPWDWPKELCAQGVTEAAATGRWAAIATSNFCGPQFRGMWRDVAWHKQLTNVIHSAKLPW